MNDIKLIITDFDGTLVDTFEANFRAYEMVFSQNGLVLTRVQYRTYFGYRFDAFMDAMGIIDSNLKENIKKLKAIVYPDFFEFLVVNKVLVSLISNFRNGGGKAAIASTAHSTNLMNVLEYLKLNNDFDLIITGEDVKYGKPNPEIYLKVLEKFNISSEHAIVFEDTEIGFKAASDAGIKYFEIKSSFFE
jgi:beta-phosphoglucomutase